MDYSATPWKKGITDNFVNIELLLLTGQFTLWNPTQFQFKMWVLYTSQWVSGTVIGIYLKIINMSVMPFCHGNYEVRQTDWEQASYLINIIIATASAANWTGIFLIACSNFVPKIIRQVASFKNTQFPSFSGGTFPRRPCALSNHVKVRSTSL